MTDGIHRSWMIQVDPVTRQHQRRASRLAERYPDADGFRGALSASNVPEPWRELGEVTLLTPHGAKATGVRKRGIVSSPSGGAFVFVLDAKDKTGASLSGLAVAGHPGPDVPGLTEVGPLRRVTATEWAALEDPLVDQIQQLRPRGRRPSLRARQVRWVEADVGGGITGFVVSTARSSSWAFPTWSAIVARGPTDKLQPVPMFADDDAGGPAGYSNEAYYEPVWLMDLDADGHPELVVLEQWREGIYTWIVRFDAERDELVAELICGDAA